MIPALRNPFSGSRSGALSGRSGAFSGVSARGLTAANILAMSPAFWFRKGIGITDAGGVASAWADQSGNGRNLSAAGAARPTINADGTLDFNGTANIMQTSGFTVNQPFTVFILMRVNTWIGTETIFDRLSGAPPYCAVYMFAGSPQLAMFCTANGPLLPTQVPVGTWRAACFGFSGASSVARVNQLTETTGDPGSTGLDGFTLGARCNLLLPAALTVAEIIGLPVLPAQSVRAALNSYLMALGGL